MLTADDIAKLTTVLATKEDLRRLEEKVDLKADTKMVSDRFDKLMKELIDIRQEQTTHRQVHDDINETLDKIISIPSIAHQIKK